MRSLFQYGMGVRSGFSVQPNGTPVLCIVIIELAEVVGDELLGGAAAAAAVGHSQRTPAMRSSSGVSLMPSLRSMWSMMARYSFWSGA